jgi:hypothetical protein
VRVVVAIGLFAIAAAAAAILLQSEQRRSGSNLTSDLGFVVGLAPGQQLCEPGELLPAETAALRLAASAGAGPGPSLGASISGPGGPIGSGVLAAGWRRGAVRIPVTRVRRTTGATVCLRNLGSREVAFGGSVPDGSYVLLIDGKALAGRLRIEYLRPGSESWLALAPTLSHRFSLAKADVLRHWAAAATLALMALALLVAVRTVLAEGRQS